jgi:putative RecB family exonuclease
MRISYSRFSTYETCPQQYKLLYVDRMPAPASPAMHFGAAVHEALSFLYDPRHLQRPSCGEVVEAFQRAWRSRENEVPQEQRDAYVEEGVGLLERHYESRAVREEGRRTAATEQFFNVPFEEEHTLTGFIDRVDVLPASGGLEVIDYKTSRRMPNYRDVEGSAQLAIYRMAADYLYPGREVTTKFLYLLHDYEMELRQTEEFLAETREAIRDVIVRIQLEDFDTNPGRHCDWCSCQEHCPLFRKPAVPEDLLEVDIAEVLRRYAEAEAEEKEAAARRAELRQTIEEYLDRSHAERVEGGSYLVERRKYKRVTSWDVERLRELLRPLGMWDRVTQVSSAAMRGLLSSKDLSREQKRDVESAAEYAETSHLRVKPSGGEEEPEDREE